MVFDPWFETIAENSDEAPEAWDLMMSNHRFEIGIDDEEETLMKHKLADDWLSKDELAAREAEEARKQEALLKLSKKPQTMVKQEGEQGMKMKQMLETNTPESITGEMPATEGESAVLEAKKGMKAPTFAPTVTEGPIASLRLNPRKRVQRQVMNIGQTNVKSYFSALDRARELQVENRWTQRHALVAWMTETMDPEEGFVDTSIPDLSMRAFKASKKGKNPDLPNFREAMEGEHREEFKKAMEKEIRELEGHGTWRGIVRSSVPQNAEIVPLTWAFRIKRRPNGDFDKFKARLVVRGDLQHDERETFAPVVKWSTIRTVLAFALKMKLKTRQIDFDNAFVQAELDEKDSIFVTLPKGVNHATHCNKDVVLKLLKSLYGMKDAPKFWFQKVKGGLRDLGFEPSEHDQCLFMHKEKKIILLLYTDDCLLFCEDDEQLKMMISAMKDKFQLTEQDVGKDVFAYLGIELTFQGTKVTMRQDGLMKKVFEKTGWQHISGDVTPAKEKPLGADLDGEPFQAEWEYASVVEILMFLVNTRPDIQFAVHQCARFTHNPKKSHFNAVKRIMRYLKETQVDGKDRGLTFDIGSTDKIPKIECYVDADFAGLWNVEHDEDPVSSKSRTGLVIFVGNCPVIWQSKLQGETALSTTEAEIVALSQSMRELLWLRRLVVDVASTLGSEIQNPVELKSKVFEDNNAALTLAKKPGVSSRTKYIHTKHWFFKEHIGEDKGIVLKKIGTEDQLADIFTKGVKAELFVPLRDRLMGWI